MKKVLITGGAGFIGYHLAKRLIKSGHKVVIADDFFRGKNDTYIKELVEKDSVQIIKVDLTKKSSWKKIGSGYDYVYHLASINGTKLFYEIPHEVLRIGIETTLNVLDWFTTKNKKLDAKILYTSSNEAYAGALESFNQLPLPTPEDVPLVINNPYNPRWSYGGQKLIGELLFINYAQMYNFRMVIVRPHNFYGPRAGGSHVIPEIIRRIEKKEDPFIIYGVDETRSFCYIDDAVEAMQVVMESNKTDQNTYHIGTSVETSIKNLVTEIFKISKWHPKVIEERKSAVGSVKRRVPDVSKIKKHTNWKSTTKLFNGLKHTVDWYRKNKN